MAEVIAKSNGGKGYFNMREAGKITGIGRNRLPKKLHDAGIPIRKDGMTKRVSAYGIAELMHTSRIAPIDNTSRGA